MALLHGRAGRLTALFRRFSARAVTRDLATKTIVATLDLSFKWSPDWNGGDMNSGPGGRRARFTGIDDIEQARQIKYSTSLVPVDFSME